MTSFETAARVGEPDNQAPQTTYPFKLRRGFLGSKLSDVKLKVGFTAAEMKHIATAYELQNGEESALAREAATGSGVGWDLVTHFSVPWGYQLVDREPALARLLAVDSYIEEALAERAQHQKSAVLSELLAMRLALMPLIGERPATPE